MDLSQPAEGENSFVSRLGDLLAVRRRWGIATGTQIDMPAVSDPAVLAMVHRLEGGPIQVTALNFSRHQISDQVVSRTSPPGRHRNRYVLQEKARPG